MSNKVIDLQDILGQSTLTLKFRNGKEVIIDDIPMELYLGLLGDETGVESAKKNVEGIIDFVAAATKIDAKELRSFGVKENMKAYLLIQKFFFASEELLVTTPAGEGKSVPLAKQ